MSVIENQATKNAIYSYLGALLGLATVMGSSHWLSEEQNGLTRILVSIASLFSMFAGLGFNTVTVRFFPYFKNKDKGHHGYLYYGIITTFIGFAICFIFFLLFKNQIVESNIEKSKLFVDYLFYLMPLTLFTLFFNLFDYYLRACYSSIIGSSAKDFTQRILILVSLFLYFIGYINFSFFVFLYVTSTCIPTIILLFYIIKIGEWHLKPTKGFVTKELKADMIKLSLFSIISGSAGVLISNIDIFMINDMLGLTKTGVYGIAFYFGTIIIIPSRSILRIAMGVVADAFKKEDITTIARLYKKSCNTQLTIGILLFIGIWSNIDNIMLLLPTEYAEGRNVILIIAAGYLIDMSTGINYIIMLTSKYYKYDAYFMFIVLAFTIIGNYILIPIYGIIGSAIATAITISSYNILRWGFLLIKYKMQPFDINTIKIIMIALACLLVGFYIPTIKYLYIDIALRSSAVGGLFLLLLLKLEASPELNIKIRKNLKRVSINL